MKSSQFPVSYFINALSPKKMFLNRFDLKIWQMLIVIVFLIFLMLNPVALNGNQFPEMKLKSVMPNLVESVEQADITFLNTLEFKEGQLSTKEKIQSGDRVFVNGDEASFSKVKTGLNFEKNQLVLKDQNGMTFNLKYVEDWSFANISSTKDFNEWLNKEWNRQTASYRTISLIFLIGILITCSTLFLVFGSSFFIWLTKKNHLSSIKSFKEAMNVTLNAMFLSTLLATIAGLIHYDISLMLMIQAFGVAITVLVIFSQTKFNDKVALNG